MKEKQGNLNQFKSQIISIMKKHGVAKAGVFGSFARGRQTKESDIDILIEPPERKFSLFDLVELESELEEKLKRKVDLLTYAEINHLLKRRILSEQVRML